MIVDDGTAILMQLAATTENKICAELTADTSKSLMSDTFYCYLVIDRLDERIVTRVAALLIKQATTVKQRRKAKKRRCMMLRSATPSVIRYPTGCCRDVVCFFRLVVAVRIIAPNIPCKL